MGTHSKLLFRTLASRRRRVEASLWSPSYSYACSLPRWTCQRRHGSAGRDAEFAPTSRGQFVRRTSIDNSGTGTQDRARADRKGRVVDCISAHVRLHPLNGARGGSQKRPKAARAAMLKRLLWVGQTETGHLLRANCEVVLPAAPHGRTNPAKSDGCWAILLFCLMARPDTKTVETKHDPHVNAPTP